MNCEPPTVANMLKASENYGLIYRQRNKLDARVNRVYLTAKGYVIKEPIEKVWRKQQFKLLDGMSSEELLFFKKLLKKRLRIYHKLSLFKKNVSMPIIF
ncbi:DNA-binding MarR family transcriptional regulator [Neobacillus niacini]|nr:DNA-binding MarR family transcriptional regulator [Neobacillus niacini]